MSEDLSRRRFLQAVGGLTASALAMEATGLGAALPAAAAPAGGSASPAPPSKTTPQQRHKDAQQVRNAAATLAYNRPVQISTANGEENDYGGTHVGNFSKGLPHNSLGEVDPTAYAALLTAVGSGLNSDFEAIPLAGNRRLVNPQCGYAFDLEGPDSHDNAIVAAPRIDSAQEAGEAAELYWMALTRDINYASYTTDPVVAAACQDLSRYSDFRGPKQGGQVTPATIFRGSTPGDLNGPYLSQFLLKDIPYGALLVSQQQKTAQPGTDYVTDFATWLNVQNGHNPGFSEPLDPTPRYLRNGRDIGHYVHIDALYEAYLNACLYLLSINAPVDAGNPYVNSRTQDGFGTFGNPHIIALVTEVATRALKAEWFCKWSVHRRCRPEAFGGLVHNTVTGAKSYPISPELLNSPVLARTFSAHGSYLLPQAFPEASPLHPSYASGHATVAGACITILKAWFDESFILPSPVVTSADGLSLQPYSGPPLTLGGELNKVGSNIASARNIAGVHWRTDFTEAMKLGEAISIGILQEQHLTYNEKFSFSLTKLDGTTISV